VGLVGADIASTLALRDILSPRQGGLGSVELIREDSGASVGRAAFFQQVISPRSSGRGGDPPLAGWVGEVGQRHARDEVRHLRRIDGLGQEAAGFLLFEGVTRLRPLSPGWRRNARLGKRSGRWDASDWRRKTEFPPQRAPKRDKREGFVWVSLGRSFFKDLIRTASLSEELEAGGFLCSRKGVDHPLS